MWYHKLALVLAAIGAINWGLAQLNFNLVDKLLGFVAWLPMVVYYIIALAGLYSLYIALAKTVM